MDLYILRHAIAVERDSTNAENDFERQLTREGEQKLRRVAKAMRKLELAFDVILTSPYVRAKQTADIAAEILGQEKRVKISESLGADRNPRVFLAEFSKLRTPPQSALLVGHEPFLSGLVSLLIGGSARPCVTLKKAGLCKMTLGQLQVGRCGTLDWLLTPRQLMLIA